MDNGTNNCLYKTDLLLKTNLIMTFQAKQLILIIFSTRDKHHVTNNGYFKYSTHLRTLLIPLHHG